VDDGEKEMVEVVVVMEEMVKVCSPEAFLGQIVCCFRA